MSGAQRLVLEVHTLAGVESGGCSSTPVEKEGRDPEADSVIWGSPGTHWERQFPILGVHLGEVPLPLRRQKSGQVSLHSPTT